MILNYFEDLKKKKSNTFYRWTDDICLTKIIGAITCWKVERTSTKKSSGLCLHLGIDWLEFTHKLGLHKNKILFKYPEKRINKHFPSFITVNTIRDDVKKKNVNFVNIYIKILIN